MKSEPTVLRWVPI